MNLVRLVIKYILYGISIGCTFFVITCLSLYVSGEEDLLLSICRNFARHSIGSMIVGIAFGGTAIVYQFDRLSGFLKVLIHFCVGMGVFYPTAIYLGWFPFYPDKALYTILQFLFSCGIFMAIWFCFFLFNRQEAKRINQRLKELEQASPRE